ncbi:hypothetical protein RJT34_04948 [Clitoria ternatea]|uniref:Cytosol aminopeptidase domain-containing protein n=1 Tax=Clitoria ternatea TaxID=43366 RepID=A0AAN9KPZ5_CLITE
MLLYPNLFPCLALHLSKNPPRTKGLPVSLERKPHPYSSRLLNKPSLVDRFDRPCPPNNDNKVVLYTTLRGVRRTFKACNAVRAAFMGFKVAIYKWALAEEATKIASTYSDVFTAKILTAEQCEELKMGSYLGVAAASTNPPHFIHLCYKPPSGPVNVKVALVGKGLIFDR